MPRECSHAFLGDDSIERMVVAFARQLIHLLFRIGDTDGAYGGVGAQEIERAIIEAATITQAMAAAVKTSLIRRIAFSTEVQPALQLG